MPEPDNHLIPNQDSNEDHFDQLHRQNDADVDAARSRAEQAEYRAREEAAKVDISAAKNRRRIHGVETLLRFFSSPRNIIGVVILCLVVPAFVAGISSWLHPVNNGPNYVSEPALTAAIKVERLSTYEYVYKGIAHKYSGDNRDKADYHVVYDGIVTASFNLNEVKWHIDDETMTITSTLPDPEITPNIDASTLQFIPEDPKTDIGEIIKLCEDDAQESALNDGFLLEPAREGLRDSIKALTLPLLINTEYKIEFIPPAEDQPEQVEDSEQATTTDQAVTTEQAETTEASNEAA